MKNIKLLFDGNPKEYSSFIFPGGEVQVKGTLEPVAANIVDRSKWHECNQPDTVEIIALIKDSDTLMEVLLLTDAVRRFFHADFSSKKPYMILELSYLPYGRQDRVCAEGESLGPKVFADIINMMKYDRVRLYDAHSDVTLALFNNLDHVTAAELISPCAFLWGNSVLVSPDNGAKKKVLTAAQKFNLPMIYGDKIRSVETGEITGTTVDFRGQTFSDHQRFLILDDICDGGRTFLELAKEIRKTYPNSQIDLYTTVGIYSKGFEVFKGIIDYIYFCTSFVAEDTLPNNVQKI